MSAWRYHFDADIPPERQASIRESLDEALASGAIRPCDCSTLEAHVYETRPPEFQASISCACDAMRPLFSSVLETDE